MLVGHGRDFDIYVSKDGKVAYLYSGTKKEH
jgi:ribosomal protein L27